MFIGTEFQFLGRIAHAVIGKYDNYDNFHLLETYHQSAIKSYGEKKPNRHLASRNSRFANLI